MSAAEAIPAAPPDRPASPLSGLWVGLADALAGLGDWTLFALRATSGVVSRHLKARELLRVCVEFGVSSVGVVAVTGLFIGMVLAVQAYSQFHMIGLDTSLGAVIHMSVVRELGPVLAAVMLAGRVGTAMAAQLATMRVTEQIDALSCLGAHPLHYLVVPRLLACALLIPLLTVMADFMGVMGGAFICTRLFGVDAHYYWAHTEYYVTMWDVSMGMIKAFFFGVSIALIS